MKVVKHHSFVARVVMFLAGLWFGKMALQALVYFADDPMGPIYAALFGLIAAGGFYGALVGKETI